MSVSARMHMRECVSEVSEAFSECQCARMHMRECVRHSVSECQCARMHMRECVSELSEAFFRK